MVLLAETGVADRCDVVSTDFFHSVVSGGDAYVLAQILHDWPDEKCAEILRKCADAMEPLLHPPIELPSSGPGSRLHLDRRVNFAAVRCGTPLHVAVAEIHI